jgi:dnd system-associated protein 4
MIERRIRFAKDKQELVKRFLSSDDGAGPFRLQADVLAFAASLGASRGRREPLPEAVAEPIRQEVFDRQGYDTLVNLLAVQSEMSAAVLEDSDEMIAKRASIFEEFANGGLSVLAEETRGQVDFSQAILLMVGDTRKRDQPNTPTFDLSKLRI